MNEVPSYARSTKTWRIIVSGPKPTLTEVLTHIQKETIYSNHKFIPQVNHAKDKGLLIVFLRTTDYEPEIIPRLLAEEIYTNWADARIEDSRKITTNENPDP